jgi:hypothetical protein
MSARPQPNQLFQPNVSTKAVQVPRLRRRLNANVRAHRGALLLRKIAQTMSFLSRLFGKAPPSSDAPAPPLTDDDPLVPVPIPALGVLLLNLEKHKGAPLSEAEVIEARGKAVCMMLPLSAKRAMDEKRGYRDIDPENVWSEWLAFKAEVQGNAL